MNGELLQEAKDKLRITWKEQDAQVKRLIKAAIAEINVRTGKEHDYENEGIPKTLMLEHVFYNWNNVLAEFYRAYAPELSGLALSVATEEIANED
jgi:hypothetical protein